MLDESGQNYSQMTPVPSDGGLDHKDDAFRWRFCKKWLQNQSTLSLCHQLAKMRIPIFHMRPPRPPVPNDDLGCPLWRRRPHRDVARPPTIGGGSTWDVYRGPLKDSAGNVKWYVNSFVRTSNTTSWSFNIKDLCGLHKKLDEQFQIPDQR